MIIEKPSRTYAWFYGVTTRDIEVNRGEGIGAHKVLAGSPIDENGNVANDETAIGLLMETVSDANPDGKIIVAGDVDALGAKNASGIELSDAAKNALSGITWREPDYVVEMQAGGGWPADLPKPSVGGYGYTEQGEQTVITWDGDTEGRDAFVLHSPYGNINCYKVAEKQSEYPEAASIEVTYGGVTASADAELTEYTGAYAYNAEGQPYVIIASAGDINVGGLTGNAPSDGVYFIHGTSGEIITKLTYGTPDIVHQIDEKYLPASGGAMVVEVNYDGEQFISSKTVNEVKNAMLTMPVIGIAKIMGEFYGVGIFSWLTAGEDSGFDDNTPMVTMPFYKIVEDVAQFEIVPLIAVADGEFVLNI